MRLAAAWGDTTADATHTAKAVAGQLLADGHELPMRPDEKPPAGTASAIDAGTQAFFAHGYNADDAKRLAQLWDDGTPIATVKARAGTTPRRPHPQHRLNHAAPSSMPAAPRAAVCDTAAHGVSRMTSFTWAMVRGPTSSCSTRRGACTSPTGPASTWCGA
jgi:hypothetical protein